ncbi:MAG: hypothetical protein ACE15E_01710 [Acidobacteriota bacterium]
MIFFKLALTCVLWMVPGTFQASGTRQPRAPEVQAPGELKAEKLTTDDRSDDNPSIAAVDGKKAWLAWQSYSGQNDEIRLRQFDGGWRTFTRLPGASGDVWRPQAVAAGKRLWIVWSQQLNGNFDIYARPFDEERNAWLETTRLSSHPFPDINHSVAGDSTGRIWVVWQGFHGDNSDVFLRHYDGKAWSPEIQVTQDRANDWEPAVALDRHGKAHIAWDTYRKGNYDVYMRTFGDGVLGPELAVTDTPRFEAHASIAVDPSDRVWVAWDETGVDWGKDGGPTDDPHWLEGGEETWTHWLVENKSPGTNIYASRAVNLAIFDGNQRKSPVEDLGAALLRQGHKNHDYPQLLVDSSSGRVGLLFHRWTQLGEFSGTEGGRARMRWEQALVFYEGDRWSPVVTLPKSRGRISSRASAAYASGGDTLWIAWPTDERTAEVPYQPVVDNVYATRMPLAAPPKPAELKPWAAPEPVPAVPAVHTHETSDVTAIRAYRATIDGSEHRIVRGDLHRHTELSWDVGGLRDGSIFDAYRYMLDAGALDFGSITDHNGGGDYEYWWWLTQKTCDMYFIPRVFTTLYGYERSVQYPGGHRNVFHTHRGVPVVSFFTKPGFDRARPEIAAFQLQMVDNDTELLYESLHDTDGISIPHTTGSFAGVDWRFADRLVEPVVELYQGARVSYEHPGAPRALRSFEDFWDYREQGFVWNAFRKGHRLGVIASSDHCSTHISYAMVYTDEPTRESIFKAVRKRHTYAATDNIVLDFRMGSHFMGDEFTAKRLPPVQVRVVGTSPIERIDIIRDEKLIYSGKPGKKEVTLTHDDKEAGPGTHLYYVRVIQDDWEMAWSSPIWVTLKP